MQMETSLFYILNGDKETNAKNLSTLCDRFGITDEYLSAGDKMNVKIDDNGGYVFDDDDNFEKSENASFEMTDIYDGIPVTLCKIDNKNTKFAIDPDMLYGRISNGTQGAVVVVDNAHDLDLDSLKAQADDDAHHAYVVNQESNFDELKSDTFKQIQDNYDSYDLDNSPLVYGIMNHVPELKQQFDHFSKTGDFNHANINDTTMTNVLDSAFNGDDTSKAFYLLNMIEISDCGNLVDPAYGSNQMFVIRTNDKFDQYDTSNEMIEDVKDDANRMKDKTPELSSLIDEGTQVLSSMAKAQYCDLNFDGLDGQNKQL